LPFSFTAICVHLPKEKSNSHFDPSFETNETKIPRDEIILKLRIGNFFPTKLNYPALTGQVLNDQTGKSWVILKTSVFWNSQSLGLQSFDQINKF
jgi:hypothetical protein